MSLIEDITTSKENEDFFSSLNKENEEKYIDMLKNSTIKIWTYINKDGLTPLHQSISLNLYELSKEIIISTKNNLSQKDFNSFINSKTNKGQTPLHYASFVGNIKLIKLLIDNGADISLKTNNNFNVLHLAIMGDKITSFYYFIKKYKIDMNSKDSKENSLLHLATYFNSKKIFNYLLSNNKVKINSKNKEGYTPLHFAVLNQNKSMIKKLLIKGANCSIKNNQSNTPYDLAIKNKYPLIQDILKGNKCKYSILKYSNLTRCYLIIIQMISISFLFFIKFDIKFIIYIIWLVIYTFFILHFYIKNTSLVNRESNYLLNLIENEEKSIEEFCLNCQIIQNDKTVHCFICNKCIEGFDHHCFWLNKCVGQRNKNAFYCLLWAMLLHSFINFIFCLFGKDKRFYYYFYNKDYIMIFFLFFNALNIILTSVGVCPLIKFYHSQMNEKGEQNVDIQLSESKMGVKIRHTSDDDELV